jgi:phenylalanyl-tRNA synthetase beta chain
MRLVVSWLREFVDVTASPQAIADTLGVRGFEVASVEPLGDDDAAIDFEITANRPDCLSVLGLAREVSVAYDLPLHPPAAAPGARVALASAPVGESDRVRVTIEDPALCPRYAAAVADVTPGTASPDWMTRRLQAAGVRPISAIVDITNYVLLELGQPMHAFDLLDLGGAEIRVRRAKPGETIRTLDGVERRLEPDMLVIADAARAQAVAGVMGGAASEVSSATRSIVLESAYFAPVPVRRTSKRLNLKTEASARFERGADPNAAVAALERAIALTASIGAGALSGPIVDRFPSPPAGVTIHLRRDRIGRLLGAPVPDADVHRILGGLGLTVSDAADGWRVDVPSFRVDLRREADLIEEVGRHHGFDRLPATFPEQTEAAPAPDPRIARDRLVRTVLTAAGLSEAVTFGFVEARAAEAVAGRDELVRVANPLSATFEVMRPSLVPGLLGAVAHNRRHARRDVGLFEVGARFRRSGETRGVGVAWTGLTTAEHWSRTAREVDFYDVKGLIERLCEALGAAPQFEAGDVRGLVPGQAAIVGAGGRAIGHVGLVDPALAESHGAPRQDKVYVAEIDLDAVWFAREPPAAAVQALPRYPSVIRDLSIVVADTLPAAIIRGTILAAGRSTVAPLAGVAFFDRYRGTGVPQGRVSVSVRLTFQSPDRTLTDAEVQQGVDAILAALVRGHGAVQR